MASASLGKTTESSISACVPISTSTSPAATACFTRRLAATPSEPASQPTRTPSGSSQGESRS